MRNYGTFNNYGDFITPNLNPAWGYTSTFINYNVFNNHLTGTIYNYDTFENSATFTNMGSETTYEEYDNAIGVQIRGIIYNHGTLLNTNDFYNSGSIYNNEPPFSTSHTHADYTVFYNSGSIINDEGYYFMNLKRGAIHNSGLFTNYGSFQNTENSYVDNFDTFINDGYFVNEYGSRFFNENPYGTFTNNGYLLNNVIPIGIPLDNYPLSTEFNNSGTLTNNDYIETTGIFENTGTLTNNCSATINGVITSNPPVETICDTDGDGTLDDVDNCVDISNADQLDTDSDGIGDVCDYTPNVIITLDVTLGDAPLDVSFTCSSVSGNIPLAYSWDFDGDGAVFPNMTSLSN